MTDRLMNHSRVLGLVFALGCLNGVPARSAVQNDRSDGWQIPPNAQAETSPVSATPDALARGRELYRGKCARCHGPGGKGDGADADPDRKPADLTDSSRAPRNPDGVMFYKVWNGRKEPKMPAFKTELSKTEVWTVIHFVKTFRE